MFLDLLYAVSEVIYIICLQEEMVFIPYLLVEIGEVILPVVEHTHNHAFRVIWLQGLEANVAICQPALFLFVPYRKSGQFILEVQNLKKRIKISFEQMDTIFERNLS